MSDKYSTKRSRRSADALKGRASGGKLPMFKIKKKVTELFILTPKDEDADVIFTTYIHKFTQGHGKNFKVLKQCASPTFTQEQDEITDLGWDVREVHGKSDSKSISNFWKQLVADNDDHVLVLDINDVEQGPQIFKMPHKVAEVVLPALDECMDKNDGDLHDYCHPEEGKILVIETNGEDGFQRKYTDVFFDEDKPASLFGDNIVSEEEFDSILNRRPSMTKLQPAFSKEEFDAYIDFCYEKAEEIGINLDELSSNDDGYNAEGVDYSQDENAGDDNNYEVDTSQDIDVGTENEAEATETRSRGRGSRGSSEAPARGGRGSRGSSSSEGGGRSSRGSSRGGRASSGSRGGRSRR
ncbi:MAG: hypothetical protein HRU18_01770 [Pseudoalteromonas sp.]|uniref:hypothetical protein n=1 Tax=Pseudoalteromonas sp. TaxID=53249 RepID=UPI001DF047B1|nr:hypothetical protein [Pseudoalteromonas sp.]NRA76910.1 hypothetical protein [Pseudoalteromonas sp.]